MKRDGEKTPSPLVCRKAIEHNDGALAECGGGLFSFGKWGWTTAEIGEELVSDPLFLPFRILYATIGQDKHTSRTVGGMNMDRYVPPFHVTKEMISLISDIREMVSSVM